MKVFRYVLFVFLLTSCGALKQSKTKEVSEDSKHKHVLAPNTASNKYSKMRQRN